MIACMIIKAHPDTNLPILASVSHAFFSGLDALLVKMDLCGHARIAPYTFSDALESPCSKWFAIDFASFIANAAPEKQPFDSVVLAEVVVGLLSCFLQHGECSYMLMGMDPDSFDPPLPEITDEIMRSLHKFFSALKPGRNYEADEVCCKYEGIELNCFNKSIKTPPKGDLFWANLAPSEKPIDPRNFKHLAEPYTMKLIVGSSKPKKIRSLIQGMDGEFRVEFLVDSFAGEYPIPETIIEVSAVLVNRTCYVFSLLGKPEYPPYVMIKDGYQLDSLLFRV